MTDEAIAVLRELAQKYPARAAYHYHLGMALYQKADYAAAMDELKSALKSNPSKKEEETIRELIQKTGK
jgi:tetratricopeptide (TPR) repeat protein